MKKIRVALVHNIISPYRIPVFNELASQKDIDLTVLFLSESARDRRWDTRIYKKQMRFNYKVLRHFKITFPFKEPVEYTINTSIFEELRVGKYDVVITSGWTDFACQVIPFLKKKYGYKFVLWAGSTKDEPSLQRTITMPFVKKIVRAADHIVAYGTKAKDYLVLLGGVATRISSSFNSVDVDHFRKQARTIKQEKVRIIKRKYSLPADSKVILYVGQFIERKNVELLINAISLLEIRSAFLVLLGYGPKKNDYLKLAKKHNVALRVIDHVELDNIPNIYGISDVLVLPSKEEVWGLVVNEAMASGLPVIVSRKVGSVKDLVINQKNGFTFNPDSATDLSNKITQLFTHPEMKKEMGLESQKIISKVTPKATANIIYYSLIKALQSKSRF
jgi:glycosyltransferase involved in cell wall biosynthesis